MQDLDAALRAFSVNVIREEKLVLPIAIEVIDDSVPFIEIVARKNQDNVWTFEPHVVTRLYSPQPTTTPPPSSPLLP
jgi:hypothetical protein